MNLKEWKTNLAILLNKYRISNISSYSIYEEAFTHKSYANENSIKYNNERLEFLGDSAINWVVTNYLYNLYDRVDEGEMSRARSNMVKTDTLAKAAIKIGLEKFLFLGNGTKKAEIPNTILENTFEAFIGAVSESEGIKKVAYIIEETLIYFYENNTINSEKDYKTIFQEKVQARNNNIPNYEHFIIGKNKISKLYFDGLLYGEGQATNYKLADQLAAKAALNKFKKI